VAAAGVSLEAQKGDALLARRMPQLLKRRLGLGLLHMGVEDGVHGRDVALARRVAPGLGRPQRPQLKIVEPFRPQAFAQHGFGEACDAGRGDSAHVGHQLDPGGLQPVDDLGLRRPLVADGEQFHGPMMRAGSLDAKRGCGSLGRDWRL